MGLFLKNPVEKLPLHEEVVAAKVMPVYGRGLMNRHILFGVGVVLLDNEQQQTQAFNAGTRIPSDIDEAIIGVLGPIGPQSRAYRRPKVLPYVLTAAHDIVPEAELLDMLAVVDPLTRTQAPYDDIEAPLRVKGMLRENEVFTPFSRPQAPEFGRLVLGEYDVD